MANLCKSHTIGYDERDQRRRRRGESATDVVFARIAMWEGARRTSSIFIRWLTPSVEWSFLYINEMVFHPLKLAEESSYPRYVIGTRVQAKRKRNVYAQQVTSQQLGHTWRLTSLRNWDRSCATIPSRPRTRCTSPEGFVQTNLTKCIRHATRDIKRTHKL